MKEKMRISVLVSGGGTNLQALIDSSERGHLESAEIVRVISSREGVFALERAAKAGIKGIVVSRKDHTDEASFTEALIRALREAETDLIVLAGYMSVLSPEVIQNYPRRIINIHPSLIPKHCGKGFYGMKVHRAVIEAKENISGATVHFVDEGIDTGEIILQREVPVLDGDDENTLAARILEVEHIILPEAVRRISNEIIEK
jgi:phosphoribosylglycinamide formyltransferase-1